MKVNEQVGKKKEQKSRPAGYRLSKGNTAIVCVRVMLLEKKTQGYDL